MLSCAQRAGSGAPCGCGGHRQGSWGFTLIELMVTISLLGILSALAAPSFSVWLRNSQVRTVSETLQSGIRLAQAEAIRRNRRVVFALTNAQPSPSAVVTAAANGKNWAIYTIPQPGETAEFIQYGALGETGGSVGITGVASACFNSLGRLVANTSTETGTGAACTLPATPPLSYNIEQASAVAGTDRRLSVTVALGGQVRMCDRDRALSSSPDGCS
jgi:type IV fimbrial biogenesis protein FimT